ncbi:single-stranded-DNA-specific exonuclease RecJ [Candidatus Falkowbacteria bacterium CG10_big_fil_rev_8_21_14_0_10_43_11]|uniref:Single-stranded-DNA-specific exonuclease RecJ n=1 Tax=Candidatus Falkowbacteria bacterium CG10_big_fil_rev_8_21_14_0_10_43_11 TaxID=1974568 RepID=A0A2M6WM88_9BACT|nr:MAG: single-stranded-DNA-specific exonuclease RecJ [Candidatus Falkowbacteria bacterium CG10_big_fil_rev_8_21_14_0_10_43_11]
MKKWNLLANKIAEDAKNWPDENPVLYRLLASRGLSAEQIKNFLELNYREQSHDPFLFKDMRAAVDLINSRLAVGDKITVYGDYDADGVTATAVMFRILNFLIDKNKNTAKIDIYIPHRETEGYGMNREAVQEIADNGTKLIITVDTGIRSVKEIALAREKGVDVILTDHHEPGEQIPDCLIINPKVKNSAYPFRDLAGVGVAFKLTQALLQSYREKEKISGKEKEVFEKWLLDLVAIGTVADLVPLIDENRILVNYGLVVLNKTKSVGIQKLITAAQSAVDKNGNKKEIDAWQIGYQLAPRLNAAGRLGRANTAYELLITQDEQEAADIAKELNKTNKKRQDITQEIFAQADSALAAGEANGPIVFAVWPGLFDHKETPSFEEGAWGGGNNFDSNQAQLTEETKNKANTNLNALWPAGVMGLVAGKLTEKYYRPSLAITEKDAGAGKKVVGSARSIPEFNVTAALEECAKFLKNFGGHKQAAGFTVNEGRLDAFLAQIKKIAEEKLSGLELAPTLDIDLEINFQNISEELYNALQKLRPFGVGNPQPKFLSKNLLVVNVINMGADGQHIKLKVKSEKYAPPVLPELLRGDSNDLGSKVMDAVAFGVIEEWKQIKVGDKIDLVYYIDMNEWNGRREVQLKIIDLKSHNT